MLKHASAWDIRIDEKRLFLTWRWVDYLDTVTALHEEKRL